MPLVRLWLSTLLFFISSSCMYTERKPSNATFEADTVKVYSPPETFTEVVSYLAGAMRLAVKRFQIS